MFLHYFSILAIDPFLKSRPLRAAETDFVPNPQLSSTGRLLVSLEVRTRIFSGIQVVLSFVAK
jgi:hypothetical protein